MCCSWLLYRYCRRAPLSGGSTVKASNSTRRGPSQATSCPATEGVLCDQDSLAGATTFVYTGSGLSVEGVPLVAAPDTGVLVLSAAPLCAGSDGGSFTLTQAREWHCCLACRDAVGACRSCAVITTLALFSHMYTSLLERS